MKFSNSYLKLGDEFFEKINPSKVSNPNLFLWNQKIADVLGVSENKDIESEKLAQIFSGNQLVKGMESIATAYAGHQFGNFVPKLGDGRAHLLGEVLTNNNQTLDIQLKGSGRTSFSRGGDGLCGLGPAIREFLMGEAMAALNVPTTRSLAVVSTGDQVFREKSHPGAVVTRVASSHLRVGTFQYFSALGDLDSLESLSNYTIKRLFPEIDCNDPKKYQELLVKVMDRQMDLIVHWMRVGFIHGVMNTDNTALSGETIDFGPCAMMGIFDPDTVFSSIDRNGRYAFGNQPNIVQWNMARFAECLIPLISKDEKKSIEVLEPIISGISEEFEKKWLAMMGKKLGISLEPTKGDRDFVFALLSLLKDQKLDYTDSFKGLNEALSSDESDISKKLGKWFIIWRKRITDQNISVESALKIMKQNNPIVIPRNHHMENVLKICEEDMSSEAALEFLEVIGSPYFETPITKKFQDLPEDDDKNYQTFCGT